MGWLPCTEWGEIPGGAAQAAQVRAEWRANTERDKRVLMELCNCCGEWFLRYSIREAE